MGSPVIFPLVRRSVVLVWVLLPTVLCGCFYDQRITSDPPGASVYFNYGEEPADGHYQGETPYEGIVDSFPKVFWVQWADGVTSEARLQSGPPKGPMHFVKPLETRNNYAQNPRVSERSVPDTIGQLAGAYEDEDRFILVDIYPDYSYIETTPAGEGRGRIINLDSRGFGVKFPDAPGEYFFFTPGKPRLITQTLEDGTEIPLHKVQDYEESRNAQTRADPPAADPIAPFVGVWYDDQVTVLRIRADHTFAMSVNGLMPYTISGTTEQPLLDWQITLRGQIASTEVPKPVDPEMFQLLDGDHIVRLTGDRVKFRRVTNYNPLAPVPE